MAWPRRRPCRCCPCTCRSCAVAAPALWARLEGPLPLCSRQLIGAAPPAAWPRAWRTWRASVRRAALLCPADHFLAKKPMMELLPLACFAGAAAAFPLPLALPSVTSSASIESMPRDSLPLPAPRAGAGLAAGFTDG